MKLISVKREVGADDEEGTKVKEQAILEMGSLLAKTNQAAGNFVL